MLSQLEQYGIEWYLTNAGDLMIKSWQFAVREFVPAEAVEDLRGDKTMDGEVESLEWVSRELSTLGKEYAGKWIAVKNDLVVADSDTFPDLLQQTKTLSIDRPFITKIPARPPVWKTAYGYQAI